MTTVAGSSQAFEHHEHEDPATRLKVLRSGLWLFFLSESFLFGGLFAARFYLSGTERPDDLSQPLGLAITSVLLFSSITAYLGENAIARGNRGAFLFWIATTIVLGVVFVAGVGLEWTTAEFGPSEKFGTIFFTMTGLHASHVVSGIVFLVMVFALGARGHFSWQSHWGVEGVVKYWHFVDVVWLFFYPALYLVSS